MAFGAVCTSSEQPRKLACRKPNAGVARASSRGNLAHKLSTRPASSPHAHRQSHAHHPPSCRSLLNVLASPLLLRSAPCVLCTEPAELWAVTCTRVRDSRGTHRQYTCAVGCSDWRHRQWAKKSRTTASMPRRHSYLRFVFTKCNSWRLCPFPVLPHAKLR